VTGKGLNLHAIGIVVLVVGAIGASVSMIFWSSWGGLGGASPNATVVERRAELALGRRIRATHLEICHAISLSPLVGLRVLFLMKVGCYDSRD